MQHGNAYALRYDGVDLSFENEIYVINWLGGGINDVISTMGLQSIDGSVISKHHVSERQIIINFRVFNETQKQTIYALFPIRKNGILMYIPDSKYKSDGKQINCMVTSVEPGTSAFPMKVTVTLICPYPFWESVERTYHHICGEVSLWKFDWNIPTENTFEFSNIKSGNSVIFDLPGTIATGFAAVVETTRAISYLQITNFYTKEFIKVGMNFPANSEVMISTEVNNKKILYKLKSDNVYTDITNKIIWGSTFFQLTPGANRISIEIPDGTSGISASLNFATKFGGV